MSRHVVIGTAGHVDHGKTALVKALTGIDTDRWEEEKRRGITIDLGFAPLDLGKGLTASVVDVPGHEDFVRNMVAGATGVDVALLVVAADEGVMPQTIEHLAILDFLSVTHGVLAVTKADLAEADWVDLVLNDALERAQGTGIHWEAAVPVSAISGAGLSDLQAALARAAGAAALRSANDLFRMPVDRAFSVAGAGTVVTGTTWSGTVSVGDEVTILPGGHRARVRGIEVHGEPREAAEPGRRTALAIAGLARTDTGRGAVVVKPEGWRETDAMDALITLLPSARALNQRSRVRVHHGTAEVLARVTPAEGPIKPGASGVVRLRLESPLVARYGDRFVIRSYSPVTTTGGGRILDPWPAARPRRPVGAIAFDQPEAERVEALVGQRGSSGVALDALPVRMGVDPGAIDRVVKMLSGSVCVKDTLYPLVEVDRASERIRSLLTEYHRKRPLEPGASLEELRQSLKSPVSLVDHVVRELADAGVVVAQGGQVRLSTHRAAAGLEDGAVKGVREALEAAGFEGRTVPELAGYLGMDPAALQPVVEYLARSGELARVGRDRYYASGQLDRMVAVTLAEVERSGRAQPAQLRDRLGLTRKYLIPFLEWLDQQGLTVREGDGRRLGTKARAVLDKASR